MELFINLSQMCLYLKSKKLQKYVSCVISFLIADARMHFELCLMAKLLVVLT